MPTVALPQNLPDPLTADQFVTVDAQKASLGHLLFYDKILSGNRNISCASCHHPEYGSGDGLSLGIGEGGRGIGPARTAGEGTTRIKRRMARNAPGLWNLGHKSRTVVFHDGRLSVSEMHMSGFASPARDALPLGLETIVAAQSLFPMAAEFEMAGNPGENEIADAGRTSIEDAWALIAARVKTIPIYTEMFVASFEDVAVGDDITIVHIANALSAFVIAEWTAMDSPFDEFQTGGPPLSTQATRGMEHFFGKAGCARCHSGPLFTDQTFHALGLPAFGPGRTRRFDPVARDVGRLGVTDDVQDAYTFLTPSLRNVSLTAPYGHNGAYPTLAGIIRHKMDPIAGRSTWTDAMARLPSAPWLSKADFSLQWDQAELDRQSQAAARVAPHLNEDEIADLVAFLESLTSSRGNARPFGVPPSVPSGLALD